MECIVKGEEVQMLLQEKRAKRQQGIEKPPWTQADEQRYVKEFVEPSCKGLCIVKIKGSSNL